MAGTGNFEVDRYLGQVTEQLQRLTEVQQELAELRGVGAAAEGLVRARVGPSGNLMGLKLDPRALGLGSEALVEAIMEAVAKATAEVAEKANELAQSMNAAAGLGDLLTGGVPAPGRPADEVADGAAAVARSADPVAEAIRRLRGAAGG